MAIRNGCSVGVGFQAVKGRYGGKILGILGGIVFGLVLGSPTKADSCVTASEPAVYLCADGTSSDTVIFTAQPCGSAPNLGSECLAIGSYVDSPTKTVTCGPYQSPATETITSPTQYTVFYYKPIADVECDDQWVAIPQISVRVFAKLSGWQQLEDGKSPATAQTKDKPAESYSYTYWEPWGDVNDGGEWKTISGSWSPVGKATSLYDKVTADAWAYNDHAGGLATAKMSDSNTSDGASGTWVQHWHYFCNTPVSKQFHTEATFVLSTSVAWNIHNGSMITASSMTASRMVNAQLEGASATDMNSVNHDDGANICTTGGLHWTSFGISYSWNVSLDDPDESWTSTPIIVLGAPQVSGTTDDMTAKLVIQASAGASYTGGAYGPQHTHCEVSASNFSFTHN